MTINLDEAENFINQNEALAELPPEAKDFLIGVIRIAAPKLEELDMSTKEFLGQLVSIIGDAIAEASSDTGFSDAVQSAMERTGNELSDVGEAINGVVASIDAFNLNDFSEESRAQLEASLQASADFFRENSPFKEVVKEATDVFEAVGGLDESLDELNRVLPVIEESPEGAEVARLDLDALLVAIQTEDFEAMRELLKDPEATPGLTEPQRLLYIQTLEIFEEKIKTLDSSSIDRLGQIMVAFGESIQEALPDSEYGQPIKDAFSNVGDQFILFGGEMNEFLEAIADFDMNEVTPEQIEKIKDQFHELVAFFRETPPFDKVFASLEKLSTEYIELKEAFWDLDDVLASEQEEVEVVKKSLPSVVEPEVDGAQEELLPDAPEATREQLRPMLAFEDVPFKYLLKSYESAMTGSSREMDMEQLRHSIPSKDRKNMSESSFNQSQGSELYRLMEDLIGPDQEDLDKAKERYMTGSWTTLNVLVDKYDKAPIPAEAENDPDEEEVEPEVAAVAEVLSDEDRASAFSAFFEEYDGREFNLKDKPMVFEFIPEGETEPVACSFSNEQLIIGDEVYNFVSKVNLHIDVEVELGESLLGGILSAGAEAYYKTDDIYDFHDAKITKMEVRKVGDKMYLVPTAFEITGEFDTDDTVKEKLVENAPDWVDINVNTGKITIKRVPDSMQSKGRLSVDDLFLKLNDNHGEESGNLVSMDGVDESMEGKGRIYGDFSIDFEKV